MSFFEDIFGKSNPKNVRKQFQMSTLIFGALAVTVSLAWSNAINALIDYYIPEKYANNKNAWFKVLFAFILTIIILSIMYFVYGN